MLAINRSLSIPHTILAIMPLGIAFLASLLTWGWRVLDWPLVFFFSPIYFLTSGILVVGALFGVARGFPRWSYTWGALALGSLGVIGEVIVFSIFEEGELIRETARSVYNWALQGTNLFWVFLALLGTLHLSRRGALDALLFFTLFLGTRLVGFPILIESEVLGTLAPVLTGSVALLAVLEGIVAAWLFIYFLAQKDPIWRPFQGMVLLVFLNAPLKVWPLLVQQAGWIERLRFFVDTVLRNWFFDAGFLVAAVAAIWLYQGFRPRKADSSMPSRPP